MIFTEKGRQILKEWVLYLEKAPVKPQDANLIPALKKAAAGEDCKTTFTSSIAALAYNNASSITDDIQKEGAFIFGEIKSNYDVSVAGGMIRVGKK